MKVTTRAAGNLVGVGLAGFMVWAVAVEAAMPSWFDPDDSCPGATGVERSYFPPSATCVHGDGRVVDHISRPETVVLAIVFVLLAAVVVTGLAVLGWRLLRHDQADLGKPKPKRPALHVLGAALLGVVAGAVARAAVILASLTAGPPGGATAFVAVALWAIGVASALDRAVGPGRGGSSGSYRRGTALVLAGATALLVLVVVTWDEYAEHNTLLGPAWAIAAGAGVFALLAAVQWIRWPVRRRSARTV
ncbi:hypothetical protein [Saccharomonospora cyanea]|uniref:Uncharacterized protein n=1 Tax=Saccharomonospora cyanea NA-134 TaxID=882082 RepID=H5XPE1_9PSEU|nr:hypothetical protein [Saccharomonospora cyanea]EHR58975.1 hypothetical protein SaccyDRAFT_0033 [Saccharomonospora cyanea NA-134]